MSRGILYVMTTGITGLVKIGRTKTDRFLDRMYTLERHGYCQATGLRRKFAIEVDDYEKKETLLHEVFEKSRVADTELFALDVNIVVQLLSSFDGTVVYPQAESKKQIFDDALNAANSKLIPNGTYIMRRKKVADDKIVVATAIVENGCWTLLRGSDLGVTDDGKGSQKRYAMRASMSISESGLLFDDVNLGNCSPSFAASVAANQSLNGWELWENSNGETIDIYRQHYYAEQLDK